jgi:hypothetical protein
MPEIVLAGRTDIDEFFKKSGVFESEHLAHHPLLTFLEKENVIHVQIIESPRKLLSFPDTTPIMGQWAGEWRSDYFQFTVGQYRHYVEEQEKVLLTARNVVKRVGPRGGFRLLSYEFVNEQGDISRSCIVSGTKSSDIEAFFARHNIPIAIETER